MATLNEIIDGINRIKNLRPNEILHAPLERGQPEFTKPIEHAPRNIVTLLREALSCDNDYFRDNPSDKDLLRSYIFGEFYPTMLGKDFGVVVVVRRGIIPGDSFRVPCLVKDGKPQPLGFVTVNRTGGNWRDQKKIEKGSDSE